VALILLVEDNAHQRQWYETELKADGHDVVTVASGREALTAVESHPNLDLIIMDINMPQMDGIEVMGRILGKHNKLPVILNTAYGSYKDNFMSWSADAYVIKSSDLSELRATIAKILAKKKGSLTA
jgi:CheY-like chemotaxis protein